MRQIHSTGVWYRGTITRLIAVGVLSLGSAASASASITPTSVSPNALNHVPSREPELGRLQGSVGGDQPDQPQPGGGRQPRGHA